MKVTASVGATLSRETDTPESIVSRADRALYEAKRSGRDRFTLAPQSVGAEADDCCS